MDYKEPMELLENLMQLLQTDTGLSANLLPLQTAPDWVSVYAGASLSCDDLANLTATDDVSYVCTMAGHGLVSNYFMFHLRSRQLRLSVAIPFGNVMLSDDDDTELENALSVIKILYLLLNDGGQILSKLQLSENSFLCMSYDTAYRMEFKIFDGNDVIREETDLSKLLDLLSESSEDDSSMVRFYA